MTQYINIEFPFKDSENGDYLELTKTTSKAIKSNLMYLILTTRGERLYKPSFGTNLKQFIFEPRDGVTKSDIMADISKAVSQYIPNLILNDVDIKYNNGSESKSAIVNIYYTITDNTFEEQDILTIEL